MVWGFTKSAEGVKAYADIGKEYDDELFDELYEQWLKETTAEGLSKYSRHKTKEITKIVRVKTGDGGNDDKEYLLYSFNEYRLDSALNVKHFWRPNVGKYPIPIPRWETTDITFGKQNRKIVEIMGLEIGYSIPFTPANLDKIRDIGLAPQVQYMVETSKGIKSSVSTYEDLRNEEDFAALVHFGKKPTPKQKAAWLEGEGYEKDLEKLQEIQRIRQSR